MTPASSARFTFGIDGPDVKHGHDQLSDINMQNPPRLLEGNLTELHYDLSKEILINRIQSHHLSRAISSSLGGAIADLSGQAASGAALAMYDGEDTQCFACLVDDQVVCGDFGGAELLKSGEYIKAVVSQEHGFLYVHALMSPGRQLIWIKHPWGIIAEIFANLKIAGWSFLLICLLLSAFAWAFNSSPDEWLETIKLAILGGGGLVSILAFWSIKDMTNLSSPSTDIFRLLGFARPGHINLNKYLEHLVRIKEYDQDPRNANTHSPDLDAAPHQYKDVYNYGRAIVDGKVAMVNTPSNT